MALKALENIDFLLGWLGGDKRIIILRGATGPYLAALPEVPSVDPRVADSLRIRPGSANSKRCFDIE